MRVEIYDGTDRLGEVGLSEKTFSTGSRGFYASAKVEVHGKRYQANFQLVEIGSKPGSK
jgi:hypothetical protein